MRGKRLMAPVAVVFVIGGLALMGFLVATLWNALLPGIFGLRTIGFWQALGLFILARLLFGRFGGWGSGMRQRRRFMRGWGNLSPEERERFRRAMQGSGGCGEREAESRA